MTILSFAQLSQIESNLLPLQANASSVIKRSIAQLVACSYGHIELMRQLGSMSQDCLDPDSCIIRLPGTNVPDDATSVPDTSVPGGDQCPATSVPASDDCPRDNCPESEGGEGGIGMGWGVRVGVYHSQISQDFPKKYISISPDITVAESLLLNGDRSGADLAGNGKRLNTGLTKGSARPVPQFSKKVKSEAIADRRKVYPTRHAAEIGLREYAKTIRNMIKLYNDELISEREWDESYGLLDDDCNPRKRKSPSPTPKT